MHKFCNGNLNEFVMLLRKGVYPYEYMDSWERFEMKERNETSLSAKKDFYSELTLEDINDKDYEYAEKVFKEYCTKMSDYHDLYVQNDALLLADVSEKFREKYIEIYGLDPSYFSSAPGIVQKACLKKTKVKLELLTDIDMLLMIEKGIESSYFNIFRCKKFIWKGIVSKITCKWVYVV